MLMFLLFLKNYMDYCIYPKYWDRRACADSVDPDQMPQNAASDQGLHCLPLIQQFLHTSIDSYQNGLFRILFKFYKICLNQIYLTIKLFPTN